MPMLKKLPLRVRFQMGEPLYGLFGRLAARNLFQSSRELATAIGLSYDSDVRCAKRLKTVSEIAGIDPDLLVHSTVVAIGRTRQWKAESIPQSSWSPSIRRVCPCCLKNDLIGREDNNGPRDFRPFLRFWWDFTFINTCPTHQVKLVRSCPSCSSELSVNQLLPWKCVCGHDLTRIKAKNVGPSYCEADHYFVGRLTGSNCTSIAVVDRLTVSMAASAMRALGAAQAYGAKCNMKSFDRETSHELQNLGIQIFKGGTAAYECLLDRLFEDQSEKDKKSKFSSNRIYGVLYRWLDTYKIDALDDLKARLVTHAEKHMVTPVRPTIFGRSVNTGKLTIKAASRSIRVDPGITFLIAKHIGIVPAAAPFKASLPVPTASLNELKRLARDMIKTRDASIILGITSTIANMLCEAGILRRFEGRTGRGPIKYLFRSSVKNLLDMLANSAPVVDRRPEKTLPIGRAVERARISYPDAVAAILQKKVAVLGQLRGRKGLNSLLVNPRDLLCLPSDPDEPVDIRRAAAQCGYETNLLRALIDRGMLESIYAKSGDSVRRLVKPRECVRLFKDYVPLSELASVYNQGPKSIRNALKRYGIDGIEVPAQSNGILYPRSKATDALTVHRWRCRSHNNGGYRRTAPSIDRVASQLPFHRS
jgi:hypothetical protein